MTPKWIETNGFHRKVATWSFVVILTEIGGSDVKAVVLHEQTSMDEARKTAVEDNPGYRFKGLMPLTDRDFAKGESNEKGKQIDSRHRNGVVYVTDQHQRKPEAVAGGIPEHRDV